MKVFVSLQLGSVRHWSPTEQQNPVERAVADTLLKRPPSHPVHGHTTNQGLVTISGLFRWLIDNTKEKMFLNSDPIPRFSCTPVAVLPNSDMHFHSSDLHLQHSPGPARAKLLSRPDWTCWWTKILNQFTKQKWSDFLFTASLYHLNSTCIQSQVLITEGSIAVQSGACLWAIFLQGIEIEQPSSRCKIPSQ